MNGKLTFVRNNLKFMHNTSLQKKSQKMYIMKKVWIYLGFSGTKVE